MGQAKAKRERIAAGLEAPPAGTKGAWKRTRAALALEHAVEESKTGRVIKSPGPSNELRRYRQQQKAAKRQRAKRSLLPPIVNPAR